MKRRVEELIHPRQDGPLRGQQDPPAHGDKSKKSSSTAASEEMPPPHAIPNVSLICNRNWCNHHSVHYSTGTSLFLHLCHSSFTIALVKLLLNIFRIFSHLLYFILTFSRSENYLHQMKRNQCQQRKERNFR